MKCYLLKDDGERTVTHVLLTEKEIWEVQDIIDEVRGTDCDCYYESLMSAFKENKIQVCNFETVWY